MLKGDHRERGSRRGTALVVSLDTRARVSLGFIFDGKNPVSEGKPLIHGKVDERPRRFIRDDVEMMISPQITHPSATTPS